MHRHRRLHKKQYHHGQRMLGFDRMLAAWQNGLTLKIRSLSCPRSCHHTLAYAAAWQGSADLARAKNGS